jgi:hypothetical protein
MRLPRSFVPLTALLGAGIILGAGCSSKDPDTSLASAGGSSAVGNGSGGSAKGGGGGSANGASKGGSAGSANGSGSGGTTGTTGGTGNATSSGGTTGTTGGTGNATSSGGTGAYPTSACEGLPFESAGEGGRNDGACIGVSNEAESVPIDLFIMMDRSMSMDELVPGGQMTRWQALHKAVETFVDSGSDGDIRAGIGFFGVTGGNDPSLDCDQRRYATPKVEIGPLDEVGPDLVAAMDDVAPGGLTPAGPALAGALEHASAWAKDNPGRVTAVVLVSDGYPTQCDPLTPSGLGTIAQQAHENAPFVRTYVIGLDAKYNLDAVALAGGTHSAFIVENGDFASSFASVLENVANTKLACEYALPPSPDASKKLDFAKVQVTYAPASNDVEEEIPSVPNLSGCGQSANGGWYYDNVSNPTSILVCPCTCARFDAGRVDVRVGCKPRVGVR